MDSAFYSCVDDTIEDAFDASSDTEPADSDSTITQQPSHTRLNSEPKHRDTDEDDRASFAVRNCHTAADWSSDSQRERLSKDSVLQGNSDSRRLPTTGSLRHRQSLADSKCSLTVSDHVLPNAGLSATDVYHSELSQQLTSRCHDNLYVSKSDTDSSRQSLLKNRTRAESANSHFQMSNVSLPSSTNRVASTMFLPDDKVMEIVEEQLENDDDDDDADTDEDVVDEVESCVESVKPVSAADEDDVDSDVDESDVDEVEEISEDDEDRLADEERAVLEEAARAAAEAAASIATSSSSAAAAACGQTTEQTANTTNVTADDSVKNAYQQSADDVPCELLMSAELC